MNEKIWENWEDVVNNDWNRTERLKVDGGYIYQNTVIGMSTNMCFVPDVDLTRYQSHLRDAYNKGYQDGLGENRMEPNTTAYNRGYKDGQSDIDLTKAPQPKN